MSDPRHWLYRPDNWPKLWKWGGVLLFLSVVAEFFVELHPGFGFAEWFSFNAIFGFLSCLVMVIFSKWLGGLDNVPPAKFSRHTMSNMRHRPKRLDSHRRVFSIPRAVQSVYHSQCSCNSGHSSDSLSDGLGSDTLGVPNILDDTLLDGGNGNDVLRCAQHTRSTPVLPNRISITAASAFILFFFPMILTNYRRSLRSPDPEGMT